MSEATFDLFATSHYIKRKLGHSQFELTIYPDLTKGPGYRIVIRDYSDVTKGIAFVVTESEIIRGLPEIINLRLEFALDDLMKGSKNE